MSSLCRLWNRTGVRFVFLVPSRTFLIPVLQTVGYLTLHALHVLYLLLSRRISQYPGMRRCEV